MKEFAKAWQTANGWLISGLALNALLLLAVLPMVLRQVNSIYEEFVPMGIFMLVLMGISGLAFVGAWS
ncbi:hypothetical protein CAI21_08560 [Alkalilimnicola ehrlichii]|uniref:hypothetical protein n=1 Tax=Alkalilimnicola ehrlichii TaxID=351052 RepID=UPI000E2FC788|nr:hypothetical protein [Alkalilimnicola ehrlichii]RFA29876.1 hypothetical protein CAI21_08560 [Alkalilimnicola ehrlichii]